MVEPLGMCTQVAVKVKGQLITLMVMERTAIEPGDGVKLAIAPAHVHVFDKTTGKRLS